MKIFEEMLIDKMKLFLDQAARRQEVIGSNLANVDTPGYRAKDLNLEEIFRQELGKATSMRSNHRRHLGAKPTLVRDAAVQEVDTGALGSDLNNVDLDKEMTNLALNMLKFSTVVQLLRMKVQLLDSSIRGG